MTTKSQIALRHWADIIRRVCLKHGVDPNLWAGILSREGDFGLNLTVTHPYTGERCKGRDLDLDDPASWDAIAAGTGDYGHGRGLPQVDDRWHKDFVATGDWTDAEKSMDYALGQVLVPALNRFRNADVDDELKLRAGVAAYNAPPIKVERALKKALEKGLDPDPDEVTTGGDYSADVLRRVEAIRHLGILEEAEE